MRFAAGIVIFAAFWFWTLVDDQAEGERWMLLLIVKSLVAGGVAANWLLVAAAPTPLVIASFQDVSGDNTPLVLVPIVALEAIMLAAGTALGTFWRR